MHPRKVLWFAFGLVLLAVPTALGAPPAGGAAEVDDFYGSYSERITLHVPAFHGIEPQLSLTYQSLGRNGFAGVGWQLEGLSVIERASPGHGAPRYDANDVYYLDGMELIPCTPGRVSPGCQAGGTHTTKIESYVRIRYDDPTATWQLWTKDGTRTTYRSAQPSYLIYKWAWQIASVVDTHGNEVLYSFDLESPYPNQITYNGVTVKFHREARPDAAHAYGTFAYHERIKAVEVWVGGTTARMYVLEYRESWESKSGRSLLRNVLQYARGSTWAPTYRLGSLLYLARDLSYLPTADRFTEQVWSRSSPSWGDPAHTFSGDFDGDGREEIVSQSYGALYVQRSTGTGFVQQVWSTTAPWDYIDPSRIWAGDVTGDGKTDLVFVYISPWYNDYPRIYVARSTGSSFVTETWLSYNANSFGPAGWSWLGDATGDGLADIVTAAGGTTWVYRSTGKGFVKENWGTTPNWGPLAGYAWLADFTGDGKADIATAHGGSIWVKRSTGTSFVEETWATHASSWGGEGYTWPADFDGDGKVDIATAYGGTIWVKRSYGRFFEEQVWTTTAPSWGGPGYTHVADFDGDGQADIATAYGGTLWVKRSLGGKFVEQVWTTAAPSWGGDGYVWAIDADGDGATDLATAWAPTIWLKRAHPTGRASTIAPERLERATQQLGGTTTIGYVASTQYANTNNPPLFYAVGYIATADGRGHTSARSFYYQGGLYDRKERRFLGFRYARETWPCLGNESACPYEETWFKQDPGSLSKPERTDFRDGVGALWKSVLTDYTTNGATLPYTSLPGTEWTYIYDGAESRRTAVTRAFDAYGNITQEVAHGDYDRAGDERTIRYLYVPNTTSYIVGKPAVIDTFLGDSTLGARLAQVLYEYDGQPSWNLAPTRGDPTRTLEWLDSPDRYVVTQAAYDTYGNVVSQTGPTGVRTTYTYDTTYHRFAVAQTIAQGTPLERTSTTVYDPRCGVRIGETDAQGRVATATYDVFCRLVREDFPGGGYQVRSFVNLGDPTTQYLRTETPGPDGSTLWSHRYTDGLGRTWRTEAKGVGPGLDVRVDTEYDPRGHTLFATHPYFVNDGPQQLTSYAYDTQDRLIDETLADGRKHSKRYGLGRVTSVDSLGHEVTRVFDSRAQLIELREKLGPSEVVTRYGYDARGNVTSVTDDAGNTSSFTYDALGRKLSAQTPDTGLWRYEYDDAGAEVARTDALGQRTERTYDLLGRELRQTTRAGTPAAETVEKRYDEARAGYYNVGLLTTMIDAQGQETYDYDDAGQRVRVARTVLGSTYVFAHAYDSAGRLLWTTYPDGDTLGTSWNPRHYNAAGLLDAIPGVVSRIDYDARGLITRLDYANGTSELRAYTPARGWLSSLQATGPSGPITDFYYLHDGVGRITDLASPWASWRYRYDELGYLVEAQNVAIPAETQTWSYDRTGHMTYNSRLGAYAYPPAGSARPHAVLGAGNNTYAYDDNGQMVQSAGRTITYNGDHLPASVDSARFVYDGHGQRLQKIIDGKTTLYLGDNVEIASDGTVTKHVMLGATLVQRRVGMAAVWLHTDHLGSVQAATDSAGRTVARSAYRPYGERTLGLDAERGFTGQRQDETGLFYLHARYYDPVLGRFISADPTVPTDASVGLDRYAYAGNDPVNLTDTNGLGELKSWWRKRTRTRHKLGGRLRVLGNDLGKIPVVFGVLPLAASAAGAGLQSDYEAAGRASAVIGIQVGAQVLLSFAGPVGALAGPTLEPIATIGVAAAVGYGSGFSSATTLGASTKDAVRSGMISGAFSGGLAALAVFDTAVRDPSAGPGGQAFEHGPGTGWDRVGLRARAQLFTASDGAVAGRVETSGFFTSGGGVAGGLYENVMASINSIFGRLSTNAQAIHSWAETHGLSPARVFIKGHSLGSWEAILLNQRFGYQGVAFGTPGYALQIVPPTGLKGMAVYAGSLDPISSLGVFSPYSMLLKTTGAVRGVFTGFNALTLGSHFAGSYAAQDPALAWGR
jgi:RHS repeat-associated protein